MAEQSTAFMVTCGGCQNCWKAATLPMPLDRLTKLLKGLFCPECGADSKQIYIGASQCQKQETPGTTKAKAKT